MAKTGSSVAGLFTSQATLSNVESAANTLTFTQLQTGLSIYDHVGWILGRLEFRLSNTVPALFNADGDALSIAITQNNAAAALSQSDPAIIYLLQIRRTDYGTAASGELRSNTFEVDFSTLPGGGILVLPNPLYLASVGSGLTGPSTVTARLYFQPVDLSDADYFNLVQARQLLLN